MTTRFGNVGYVFFTDASPQGTHHITIDEKPAMVYTYQIYNFMPVQHPYHGHRAVPKNSILYLNLAYVLSILAFSGAFIY
jgi:hypothetical protein